MKKSMLLAVLPVVVSGCWTFNESEYPQTAGPHRPCDGRRHGVPREVKGVRGRSSFR